MRVYEGMFLFDSGKSSDWNATTSHVYDILKRYGAEILEGRKWDERRLAYPIDGLKRGAYLLVYFDAPRSNIASIRHDLGLSQLVLRYLIVAREKYQPPAPKEPAETTKSAEAVAAPTEAKPAEATAPAEPPARPEPSAGEAEAPAAPDTPGAGAAQAGPVEASESAAETASTDQPSAGD